MKFEEGKNKVVNQTKICNDNVLFIMVGIINCGFHGHATTVLFVCNPFFFCSLRVNYF
jgi:hypothetical protein